MPDMSADKALVQRALDLLETAANFDRKAAMKCHMAGLQGEKRRMRYLYRTSQNIVDCLQHSVYDIFNPGMELYPTVGTVDVYSMSDCKSCIQKAIETLWKVHDEAHSIANDMVLGKLKGLSDPLYEYCSCLMSIIGEMQRNYRSYELSGWDWHHISRHQETECNIHDKYEGKEKSQGYSDGKEA